MKYSEAARRFTCLFKAPDIVEYEKHFYEQALIHRTLKGDRTSQSKMPRVGFPFTGNTVECLEMDLSAGCILPV